jgi:hypothetical protein
VKTGGGFLLPQPAAISYSQSHPEQLVRLNCLRSAHSALQRPADLTLHGSRGLFCNRANPLVMLDSQAVFSSRMSLRLSSVGFPKESDFWGQSCCVKRATSHFLPQSEDPAWPTQTTEGEKHAQCWFSAGKTCVLRAVSEKDSTLRVRLFDTPGTDCLKKLHESIAQNLIYMLTCVSVLLQFTEEGFCA